MKVIDKKKIVMEYGSLTSFAKTTPFTLNQLNALWGNKNRKYFHGTESKVFQLFLYLDEKGYMIEEDQK